MQSELRPSQRGPGLLVGDGVTIPDDAEIGAHVVLHAGTLIGPGAILGDGAVLGKPPTLGAHSASRDEETEPARVGAGAAVLAGAIVFAGAEIADGAIIGDQAHVRERSKIGYGSVVGRGSAVDCEVSIGDRVRIQTNCYLTGASEVEDDVFLGPGVTTTNDNTMARHPPGVRWQGPRLRRACRVGGGAVLCPGVEIGEEAYVAAGAVVIDDVPPRTVVMGVPGRPVRTVPDADLLERR